METKAGGQRYLLGIWIALGVLTPLTGFLGARGFAPLVGVTGLFCIGYFRPGRRDWAILGLLAALVLWSAVSVFWTPAPNLKMHSLKDAGRFTALHMGLQVVLSGALVLASARMQPKTARTALAWLSYGLVALAVVLMIESLDRAAVYQRLQHLIHKTVRPDLAVRNVAVGGYVLAALFWPVAAALWRAKRGLVAVFLAVAVVGSTVLLRGDSPTLAMAASAVVFFGVLALGRPAVLGLMGVTAAYWLATPAAMLGLQAAGVFRALDGRLPASWNARLHIWTFALGKWVSNPLLGLGLDSSRAFGRNIPLHPHDGGLQIWLELGILGAVLAAGFWTLLLRRIAAEAGRERLFTAAACAAATVYLVIGAISFSLWQEWWVCLGALAMAACVALRPAIGQDADLGATVRGPRP